MITKHHPFWMFLCFSAFLTTSTLAQVGIGTVTPDDSSILEVHSDSAGVLLPRLTISERDAIQQPAKALVIFNMDENCYQFNQGTPSTPDWICLASKRSFASVKAKGSLAYHTNRLDSRGRPTGASTEFTGTVVLPNGSQRGMDTLNTKKLELDSQAGILKDFAIPSRNGTALNNRIEYTGISTRSFRITCTVSYFSAANNLVLAFYLAKGHSGQASALSDLIDKSRIYKITNGSNDIATATITTSVQLSHGDFIEVWASRHSGGGNHNGTVAIEVSSLNLVVD